MEHEILNILVATGGKCRADRLQHNAQILVGRPEGVTNAALAVAIAPPLEEVMTILEQSRLRLQAFLDKSPLMPGLILAQGALRVYWAKKITAAVLNSGRKLVAVLPHRTYCVRYLTGKTHEQMARKAGDRVCTRIATLGRVGALTVKRLVEGKRELQDKW